MQVLPVDINNLEQVKHAATTLQGERIDLLFVIAGISDDPKQLASRISGAEFQHVFVTNALSPIRTFDIRLLLVAANGTASVMSSALGSIVSNIDGGFETYRASKAALNSLLRSFAARQQDQRTYDAMMPGWVQTDMGGPDAQVTVQDSVEGMTQALVAHAGQGGTLLIDYQDNVISW